jgi:single-strand DNA-binding protein
MAGETWLTLVGNMTDAAELRYTNTGNAVARFTIASTPRTFDKASGKWKDAEALFQRCVAFGSLAENIAESTEKGARVVAQGRLYQRSYEKDGQKRSTLELNVDACGPDLRWATAKVNKAGRSSGSTKDDPWASDTGLIGGNDADPPF